MKKWNQQIRWDKLREEIDWHGEKVNAVRFLEEMLEIMPEDVCDVLYRFYIVGDTQDRDSIGTPVKTDARFYQLNRIGRQILKTCVTLLTNDTLYVKLKLIVGGTKGLETLREELSKYE